MKHSMSPKNSSASPYDSPPPSSSKQPRPSSNKKHLHRNKENAPPSPLPPHLPDPIPIGKPPPSPSSSPLQAMSNKATRSALPPRPPSSGNPLKRKLCLEAENSGAAAGSDSGVKVVVRVRPQNQDEQEGDLVLQKLSADSLAINGQTFTFDAVADVEATQVDIFDLVGAPLVENCIAGFNSSIFAYGQTGSGKTYTMWGPTQALLEDIFLSQRGLAPRIVEHIFSRITEEQNKHADKHLQYHCSCSVLEIYNEQITDLLDPRKRNLQIREDVNSGVYVENLTEERVCTVNDVRQLLIRSLATGLTCFKTSRINLVDLAGSERQKLTGAAGEQLKEAGNINRSLSQLGNLINILAEISKAGTGKQRHIPYRDSKLTFLLQESLGGNAKLAMVCAVSPTQRCKGETYSTLRFAQRAKAIRNKAVVNEVMHENVKDLHEVIRQLREELLRYKAGINVNDPSRNYMSGQDVRRSLNILRMSLQHPMILPQVDGESDEEMEIEEIGAFLDDVSSQLPADRDDTDKVDGSQPGSAVNQDTDVVMEEGTPEQSSRNALEELSPSTSDKLSLTQIVDEQPSNQSQLEFPRKGGAMTEESVEIVNPVGETSSSPNLHASSCDATLILKSPVPSISPRITSTSRKSLRTSSMLTVSQKDKIGNCNLGLLAGQISPKTVQEHTPNTSQRLGDYAMTTEQLAASLHRGLEMFANCPRGSFMRRSSFRFSCKSNGFKSAITIAKFDVGVQVSIPDDAAVSDALPDFLCSNCQSRGQTEITKTADDNLQLVPVGGSEPVNRTKKQIPKAVEKVLAGSFRREMALEKLCAKQAVEITQLNRLVQQYKHERECNAVIAQIKEDKIHRLESLMDGVLPTEEFMGEEYASLSHEHQLLAEKYENHPEVLRSKMDMKMLEDELEKYRNFFDLEEREVLLEEIQDLRSQLQLYVDASATPPQNRGRPLLLTYSCGLSSAPSAGTIPEAKGDVEDEKERKLWQEAESKWSSLAEELREELEASRLQVDKLKQDYDTEKKCTEDLKEAMQLAMDQHVRILEQYADLEEKHIQLLARHRKIQEGTEDVKTAAVKAGVRGAESKFINALATEISALKVERERERRYLRDEINELKTQLQDTAEAVQAAGELLVRLKEAEEAVAAAQKRVADADQEVRLAHGEIEKLKREHQRELQTLNHLLAESEAPGSSSTSMKDPPNEADRNWREGFKDFGMEADGGLSELVEPTSWFSGYDRCNI
ncbi:hypothetical protein MLD38_036298 [Melastoma candidum]|uniref:Uncharacterized protein n=1 Tax=Melastoma candidum TaxID=119954 RepID=A0ACB9LJ76_9MYRT|nr:hypothetical protein MLD38_036298 [Melastoma candidum]